MVFNRTVYSQIIRKSLFAYERPYYWRILPFVRRKSRNSSSSENKPSLGRDGPKFDIPAALVMATLNKRKLRESEVDVPM